MKKNYISPVVLFVGLEEESYICLPSNPGHITDTETGGEGELGGQGQEGEDAGTRGMSMWNTWGNSDK